MGQKKTIGISEAQLGKEEALAVAKVMRRGWISQGEEVAHFEAAFSAAHGDLPAVAVCNATAGLHLALHALGIGPGDSVLVPGLTFVGAVNAVLYTGAEALPVDVQGPTHPHICLKTAATALTPSTRAVMVMHHAGYAVDMQAWADFAAHHGLLLLEDAAHAPGLPLVGRYSHAAVFSFFANKNMTCAEGGMILTRDVELAARLRRLRGHAMSSPTLHRTKGHAFSYDVDELGFNYRLDDIRAALGLVQLRRLAEFNARRRELSQLYYRLFSANIPDVQPIFDAKHETTAHLFCLLLPQRTNRASVMRFLFEAGIQTSIHYPPYHRFTWHKALFSQCPLPHTEEYCSRTLTLPLHPGLTEMDVHCIVTRLGEALCLTKSC